MTTGQKRFYQRWTDAEVGQLASMYTVGRPVWEIAAALGRDLLSVRHKARNLGLQRSGPNVDRRPRPALLPTEDKPKAEGGFRPCMCCGTRFHSEGKHNRLCSNCRRLDRAVDEYRVLK